MNIFLFKKISSALQDHLNSEHPADSNLSYFFKYNTNLGVKERGEVAETYYGIIRNKLLYENLMQSSQPENLVVAHLVIEKSYSDEEIKVLSPDFTISIQAIKDRLKKISDLWIRYSLPEWIFRKLAESYDEKKIKLVLNKLTSPSYLDVRVNTIKEKSREVIIKNLQDNLSINPKKIAASNLSPIGVRLPRGSQIQNLPIFKDGLIEVQDEGSQILSFIVDANRKHMVADFCAGAGGKTLALGAMMSGSGRLYAFDVNDKRLTNLRKRLKRSGLSNTVCHHINNENDIRIKRLRGKFDRVLVDAPCSGLGTIRRNPDLKWKHDLDTIFEMQKKQLNILTAASKLTKLGGRLIYATCSFMPEENEDVVNSFLKDNSGFKVVSIQPILDKYDIAVTSSDFFKTKFDEHDMDGFFAAVLERVN
ncbi:Fmu (Sun) domain protein [beta proteobacterium KB13]|uniref:Fmu (Sun) domain protein n=1 Tax=beta proteobacterium KB13 TaxID=314607 RepID=B6BVD9_9PROT|nr:Fmu (Sun) domain protein [beta proteobacterium KB13]